MERKTEEQYNRGLLEFIQNSPSMFHVADNMKKRLEEAGFAQLREKDSWELSAGGAYYVARNDSSLIAFRLPAAWERSEGRPFKGYHIVAAHSDSPTFKVKTRPETVAEGCYVRLNVENYGGMILSTWLDRPLSVAGRVAVRRADGGVDMRLVNLDRDLLVIPNLAVHMNRDINKGYGYNPQTDMLPLMGLLSGADEGEETAIQPGQGLSQEGSAFQPGQGLPREGTAIQPGQGLLQEGTAFQSGQSLPGEETTSQPGQSLPQEETASQPPQGMLLREIARELGIAPEDILDSDLYLYVRERGRVIGRDGELLLSPKLDDLQCVYAGLEGFVSTVPGQYANVLAVFDNEEVGSGTRQGADSTFLEDVLLRIQDSLGYGPSVYRQLVADSFLISADNAHAVHPAHPEKADPTNRPLLGGGIVIKYHGGQKYTSDALSAAQIRLWCERAGVPCQTFANRSDAVGGSTLGNISTSHVSLTSVDIGLPQLAMHSAVETGCGRATAQAVAVFEQFWRE